MPERGRVVLNRSFMGRGLLMFGVGRVLLRAARFPMGNADCGAAPRARGRVLRKAAFRFFRNKDEKLCFYGLLV